MSIKNFDENSDKWIVHSTNSAKNIFLLDLSGIFESNNVEDALKELNEDIKKAYTKDETDAKIKDGLSTLYTSEEIDSKFSDTLTTIYTNVYVKGEIDSKLEESLNSIYTTEEVDEKFDNIDSNDVIGGFYLVDTLSDRNSISISKRKEGMLCWVKNERLIYQLLDGLENTNWSEFKTGSDVTLDYDDISYMGVIEPDNKDLIWFDSSTDGMSEIVEDNPIINELTSIITSLSSRILELEQKVEYLILNGGSGGGTGDDDDDSGETTGTYLLLEDGSKLLLEDGSGILLESASATVVSNNLLLEDGSNMLLEDGSNILLEN